MNQKTSLAGRSFSGISKKSSQHSAQNKSKRINHSNKIRKKVLVWIFMQFENEYYFLTLKTIEKRGGYWQPVTGSVDPGETFEQAALREVSEETDFERLNSNTLIDLNYLFEYKTAKDTIHEKCFGIKLKNYSSLPIPKLEPKEHTDFEWVSFEEAVHRIKYESNKEALGKLYQLIFI